MENNDDDEFGSDDDQELAQALDNYSRTEAELSITMARKALLDIFGFKAFKEGQEPCIQALLRGESAAAIFPTGGGKSICYQLPGILFSNLTIVVCPLIALMKDQCDFLQSKGVQAEFFNSTIDAQQVASCYERIRKNQIKILYVAPERFRNEAFMNRMRSVKIDLLAIDESHCISEWGHAFRPDYLLLKKVASELLDVKRVLCCTATATRTVASDILTSFNILPKNMFCNSFYRENLHLRFESVTTASKNRSILLKLSEDLKDDSPYYGSGIIYITTQNQATEFADFLVSQGYDARAYHAGMKTDERTACQEWFMQSSKKVRIVVATIAFGMGIDKTDIRFVYHAITSKSLEGYSQEIGRAGRDGRSSICRTFYCIGDLPLLESFATAGTPSLSTCRSSLVAVFKDGHAFREKLQVAEINHYHLGRDNDMRGNTIQIILVHLAIYGEYLEPLTPVKRDLIMHRYKILKKLDQESFEKVALDIFERQQLREKGELSRLQQLIDLYESAECQSRLLSSYFSHEKDANFKCGNCQYCITGSPLIKPLIPIKTSSKSITDAVRRAFEEKLHKRLSTDEFKTLGRFLLGVSSPQVTKNKLKHHSLHGSLEGADFNLVYQEIVKQLGVDSDLKRKGLDDPQGNVQVPKRAKAPAQ